MTGKTKKEFVTFLNSFLFQTLCYNAYERWNYMDSYYLISDTSEEVTFAFKELFMKKRNELNLSVRELGKIAGVSYTVIYDFEQRNVLPKIETLMKIAKALHYFVDIKRYQGELFLSFYKNQDFIGKKPNIPAKLPKKTVDEQLSKLLTQKGLQTKEIEEIKDFIDFKLSQHKK